MSEWRACLSPMNGISDGTFAELMAQLSPFAEAPIPLALAVSGGRDSMALCMLADRWACAQGRRVVCLTVDHGLRHGSVQEAEQVGRWLAARGIEHHVLNWIGPKPRTRIQEKARDARYGLLTDWCRSNGVRDLALAHQLEDQAETFVMRLGRGSGPDGLAGMSAVVEMQGVRVIRPLLGVSRGALAQTLKDCGQDWLDDPSNRNHAFERIRIRDHLPLLAGAGYPPEQIAGLAAAFGHLRTLAERETATLLADVCHVHPAGFAEIDTHLLGTVPRLFSTRALARVAACVGGAAYPAERQKLADLYDWVCAGDIGKSLCLARCRFQKGKGGLIVSRENRGLPKQQLDITQDEISWDGRFRLYFNGSLENEDMGGDFFVGPLGRDGWAEIVAVEPALRDIGIGYPARLVLPAIRDALGVREVPHLSYQRSGTQTRQIVSKVDFSPRNKLFARGFCLAPKVSCTIS